MGKNCSVAFRPEMHDAVMRRLSVESDLRRALNAHELILYFQPMVSLADGQPVGVEALVRWTHPERGLLLPEEFVSLAEDCGLIRPLGRWVLEEACHQTRRWTGRRGNAPFDVAVNVSARQLE